MRSFLGPVRNGGSAAGGRSVWRAIRRLSFRGRNGRRACERVKQRATPCAPRRAGARGGGSGGDEEDNEGGGRGGERPPRLPHARSAAHQVAERLRHSGGLRAREEPENHSGDENEQRYGAEA